MMANLPLWAAVPIIIILVLSGLLCLIGGVGMLRLSNFYQRIHGPAMISTFGAFGCLGCSMLFFTLTQQRLVVHELLIVGILLLTAPVTAMMLMRAVVARDRRAGRPHTPPPPENLKDAVPSAEHPDE
ncbi:monovalent cation/H(+) antiporter subunit G [Zestomonas carbonaria]|uniref:Na(+)/H(+) antiporter subunit G n=1 Tax=Zestomonas carbonaria TaxID=2762745 RepID=A0A7U7I8D7_9GAMM|nr:monovalent cation/H(+) antiporter subunit G [Pseudomonas carbonaria]CAD5107140.1 Na(+)/H(+) antiporter subunit G [Pseudomonas carbonaria]